MYLMRRSNSFRNARSSNGILLGREADDPATASVCVDQAGYTERLKRQCNEKGKEREWKPALNTVSSV